MFYLDEGDERGYDQRDALRHDSGQLIAQRLPRARRHTHEHISVTFTGKIQNIGRSSRGTCHTTMATMATWLWQQIDPAPLRSLCLKLCQYMP